MPVMGSLGFFNIDDVEAGEKVEAPKASFARIIEASNGKDTTIGHWEISGVERDKPLPVYPNGFPADVVEKYEKMTGRKVLCNLPYSGTQVLDDYGEEHMKTGDLIVYTSADSVFQVAAHEEIVSVEQLYDYCQMARDMLTESGEHAVGRVIARPFVGTGKGAFTTAYEVMNNWGANHGAISYGHIGADLITMCSMLRIPVCMHNVPEDQIYRPACWNAFGMDKEGQDYRACATYGPMYK